jgi:mannose-6-phosphate isomerase-like protein (cupin superfamily)
MTEEHDIPGGEVHLRAEGPETWPEMPQIPGLRMKELWAREGGLSIALLSFEAGAGIPRRHRHASNQFMYCVSGRYNYVSSGLELTPGDFYWNPLGNEHGPTEAVEPSILFEIYDGPHYFEDKPYG